MRAGFITLEALSCDAYQMGELLLLLIGDGFGGAPLPAAAASPPSHPHPSSPRCLATGQGRRGGAEVLEEEELAVSA